MSLETRVDVLELDVALLRVETRGWAAIALSADRKAGMSAELLNLVYREVLEIKTTLRTEVGGLKADVSTLKTDVSTLKTDVGTLKTDVAAHGEILREHGEMLREILARLP